MIIADLQINNREKSIFFEKFFNYQLSIINFFIPLHR